MKRFGGRVWFVLIVFRVSLPVSAAILHVPAEYVTIADAVGAAVDGDTVLIADGVYTGYGNRNIHFEGKAITVTSENGPGVCIIDCDASPQQNHRGFLFVDGETDTSVLSGVTIRNGYIAQGSMGNSGGGIFCDGASPVIDTCVIENNYAFFPVAGLNRPMGCRPSATA
ncbi:MAG TPA: hypothetical protein PLV45_04530 [bacterium]|nr:hypothetical protein [bacterium]